MSGFLKTFRTLVAATAVATLVAGCGSSDTTSGTGSKQSDTTAGVYQGSFMADYSNKVSVEKKQRSVHMVVSSDGTIEMKHEGRTFDIPKVGG